MQEAHSSPQRRAWCVASEIDLPWTYIGGPRGLIDAILADDRIEALPATGSNALTTSRGRTMPSA
jgi:hypothetical protein